MHSYQATIVTEIEAQLGAFHQSSWAEITVISLMVAFALAFTGLAYKLYQEFGWSIYKKIGADLMMRGMHGLGFYFYMLSQYMCVYIFFGKQYKTGWQVIIGESMKYALSCIVGISTSRSLGEGRGEGGRGEACLH